MSQTVIGIFENAGQAQEAKSYLLANGFNSENLDVSSSNSAGSSTSSGLSSTNQEEGFGDRISGFFRNLFEDENDSTSHIAAGRKGTIVTVHAQSKEEAHQALQVLDNFGAVDVNEYAERSSSSNTQGSENAIPVIEEELQVGKREVETGGIRLRSRIVERPVEESIRLREEHVHVERSKVDREATGADFDGFKEGTIEVREHAERPVVTKEARIVEEVSLNKEISEKEETISDSVRHTEIDTEVIPGKDKTYTGNTNTSSDKL